LPWPPCPAMPYPVCHQLHREQAVTGRIFQALPNFCPHRQTPCLLIYIYSVNPVHNALVKPFPHPPNHTTWNGQWLEEFSKHCPTQTNTTVALIYKIVIKKTLWIVHFQKKWKPYLQDFTCIIMDETIMN
jgi:hypothetical protein